MALNLLQLSLTPKIKTNEGIKWLMHQLDVSQLEWNLDQIDHSSTDRGVKQPRSLDPEHYPNRYRREDHAQLGLIKSCRKRKVNIGTWRVVIEARIRGESSDPHGCWGL